MKEKNEIVYTNSNNTRWGWKYYEDEEGLTNKKKITHTHTQEKKKKGKNNNRNNRKKKTKQENMK